MMTGRLTPGGFTEVMFRMHVLWCLMFLPRQISNNGMSRNDRGSHTRIMLQSELSLSPLSSLLPLTFFFHLMNPKQHQHNAVLSGLQQALWLVLIEIIVWHEAEPPLCPSRYSYHGVTGWHTDSAEILQGAEGWKCILAQHWGCNPRRTSKLVDTVCCVLSTTTVILELCTVCCGGSLRIAWWYSSCYSVKLASSKCVQYSEGGGNPIKGFSDFICDNRFMNPWKHILWIWCRKNSLFTSGCSFWPMPTKQCQLQVHLLTFFSSFWPTHILYQYWDFLSCHRTGQTFHHSEHFQDSL